MPPQVCCGLPLISNGLYAQARGRARTNLDVLAGYARAGYRIVGTSTSCTHTFKAEYREMLDIDDDDARAVAAATWDICEFLLDLHDAGQARHPLRDARPDAALPRPVPAPEPRHRAAGPRPVRARARPAGDRHGPRLLRHRRHLRPEEREVRHRDGRRRAAVRADPDERRRSGQPATRRPAAGRSRPRPGPDLRHPVEILAEAYAAGDRGRSTEALVAREVSATPDGPATRVGS